LTTGRGHAVAGFDGRRMMLKPIALVTALLAGFALASVSAARNGDDDPGYGYGYGSGTTAGTVEASSPSAAAATTISYKATMTPKAEVPKPKAPATAAGSFIATVTRSGGKTTLRWTLTFRNLSGKAFAAHLHNGRAGVAGSVSVPLCGPCKTGQQGRTTISSDVAAKLARGVAYANVHTAKNAAGEIRGQLRRVGS
jgi:hypothetical protein